jgi:Arc/MetJ family transcription regulator
LSNTQKYDILAHRRANRVRTNIDIDDGLMREAMRTSGAATKKAAVEAGLRLLVQTFSQGAIRKLQGKVRWEGNLNQSRLGRIRES